MNAARRTTSHKPKKEKKADTGPSRYALLYSRGFRRIAVSVLMVGTLIAAGIIGWQRYGEQVVQRPEYVIEPEKIEVNEPPPWVKADVKAEVIGTNDLSGLSLLDERLTVKVARAFAGNPWVARVVRVCKYHPARVVVKLDYREPVAMVEVVIGGSPGLLPVDASAVLLPPRGFTEDDTREYLRIAATGSVPAGGVGETWNDRRVKNAATLARLLKDHWRSIGVYRIVAIDSPANEKSEPPSFELHARNGSRVIWGAAPTADNHAQLQRAVATIAQLVAYTQQNGSLDAHPTPVNIDVRGGVAVRPQTAANELNGRPDSLRPAGY